MANEKQQGKEISRTEGRTERMPRAWNPFEDMDRMFESFFPQTFMQPWRLGRMLSDVGASIHPRVDVVDRDNEVVLRAEVPGIKKEDIDVSVTNDTVTIRGMSKREEKTEEGEFFRSEIARGAFSRTIALPAHVDSNNASASCHDGILELKLPKVEKSKRRSIPVS